MASYQITWVEIGTNNAACIGLDEFIESSDYTPVEMKGAVEYKGECAGVDLEKYEPIVEVIE